MYKNFFGFKEKPFKLVPDPAYLYMSKSHDSALAQLTYAIEQGDGFVLITGEVGTGKTTLCRLFLGQMAAQSESAYIFNTRVNALQLLESICAEFGLSTGSLTNLKVMLDQLNAHLISLHRQNKKAILVIDEAQNMSVSNLETIRMLSNLETSRNKLLQIVLTGQPELVEKLESYELRQLAQRIAVNIELVPLSLLDTGVFIKHRLAIAAGRQLDLFTVGAVQVIYKYSGGIPRLINIAAEYALMRVYELKKPKVTRSIASAAIRSVRLPSRSSTFQLRSNTKLITLASACIIVLAFGAGLFLSRKMNLIEDNPLEVRRTIVVPEHIDAKVNRVIGPATTDAPTLPVVVEPQAQAGQVGLEGEALVDQPQLPDLDIQTLLAGMDPVQSRFAALVHLLALWQQPSPHPGQFPAMTDDATYFRIAALQYGLQLLEIRRDLDLVRKLNLPAIVALAPSAGQPFVYLALTGVQESKWLLTDGEAGQVVEVAVARLETVAVGTAYVFWNNLLGTNNVIAYGSPAEAVAGAKRLLRLAGLDYISADPAFDVDMRQAVMEFQKRNNIPVDGLIGPLTKILLINQDQQALLPKLDPSTRLSP